MAIYRRSEQVVWVEGQVDVLKYLWGTFRLQYPEEWEKVREFSEYFQFPFDKRWFAICMADELFPDGYFVSAQKFYEFANKIFEGLSPEHRQHLNGGLSTARPSHGFTESFGEFAGTSILVQLDVPTEMLKQMPEAIFTETE